MRGFLLILSLVLPLSYLLVSQREADAQKNSADYVTIFNGKNLDGWHISAQTGHSRASKNKTGGKWVVENGVLVGSQDIPGNGGIIITDKAYKNFEIVLEMKNDFGPDSGLFLRSNDKGQAYQAMIDYHADGNLMGIYGEGLPGGQPNVRNFDFLDEVTKIKKHDCPFPLPIAPEKWADFWKHGQWNELKARIVGNPPTFTTWIKGVKFMEYSDDKKRHQEEGGIALQVHGGGDYTKQFVRYRNIRVKVLD
ncbi:MAG TPA: DUF1080 domain-containing protein [Gemmataceae bacterium]|nr:DUF1080 domain-containing protein [Gemmataceae bacterium]